MSTALEQYDACMQLHRDNKITESMDGLEKLILEHPDFALAYNALAAFYKKDGQLDKAIESAEKYTELEPEDAFGYTILSSFCIAAGMKEKAEEALMKGQDIRFRAHFTAKEKENNADES